MRRGKEDPLARLREQNPNISGWIAVPYTNNDYPIVRAKDDDYYLRRDLNGNYAAPGTVFVDCRCAPDGSVYSILWAQHEKRRHIRLVGALCGQGARMVLIGEIL